MAATAARGRESLPAQAVRSGEVFIVQTEEDTRQPFAAAEGDTVDTAVAQGGRGPRFEANGLQRRDGQRLGLARGKELPLLAAEREDTGAAAAVAEGGLIRAGGHDRAEHGDKERPSSVQVRAHGNGLLATSVL